ncbi:MAG: serine/threonine-protein kinase [Nannocystaceae bacterium]
MSAGLERYQIMEPLGAGSQGRTFRAIDRETHEDVAIKVLHLGSLGGDWKPFDLFEREAAALASLSHPGIPRYLDRFAMESSGDFFLVMERIAGAPLSQRLGAPHDPKALIDWLRQALEILDYLHSRVPPVIHRDIKPSNLILRPDGRLCLIDFGGVRLALQPEGGSTMIGTFGYMAPEQLHGEATPATDIYALGATICAMAAGLPADQLPRRGLRIDVDAVLGAGPLREVLRAMLEPDPSQRLADASAVRRVLDGAAAAGLFPPRPNPEPTAASTPASAPPGVALDHVQEPDYPALRRLPAFLRFFVWIWAWVATSLFLVVEFVGVPMIYAIRGQSRRYQKERRRRRLKAREAHALAAVQGIRRRLHAIATQTDPREPPALTEGTGPREQ